MFIIKIMIVIDVKLYLLLNIKKFKVVSINYWTLDFYLSNNNIFMLIIITFLKN